MSFTKHPSCGASFITTGKCPDAAAFVARMLSEYPQGFVIRNADFPVIGAPANHYGVRVSTHLWHDARDIDLLVDAMWDLSRKI
ncbi:hypothetical protein AVAK2825_07660 [Acidovorax sp. SUPP2825]|nr:hypothetical protein AVAK2825_07660 [Acidovorax sp. SUPP2825]